MTAGIIFILFVFSGLERLSLACPNKATVAWGLSQVRCCCNGDLVCKQQRMDALDSDLAFLDLPNKEFGETQQLGEKATGGRHIVVYVVPGPARADSMGNVHETGMFLFGRQVPSRRSGLT